MPHIAASVAVVCLASHPEVPEARARGGFRPEPGSPKKGSLISAVVVFTVHKEPSSLEVSAEIRVYTWFVRTPRLRRGTYNTRIPKIIDHRIMYLNKSFVQCKHPSQVAGSRSNGYVLAKLDSSIDKQRVDRLNVKCCTIQHRWQEENDGNISKNAVPSWPLSCRAHT